MLGRFLVAASLLALAGCKSAAPPEAVLAPDRAVTSSLVLRSGGHFGSEAEAAAMQRPDEQAWEYGRNDERLNVGWTPPAFAQQYATVRTSDWLYTSNGRPLEYSATYIRTFTERAAR